MHYYTIFPALQQSIVQVNKLRQGSGVAQIENQILSWLYCQWFANMNRDLVQSSLIDILCSELDKIAFAILDVNAQLKIRLGYH